MKRGSVEWIRAGLEKPGKTQTGLAEALNRYPSAITSLLKGDRKLKADEIEIIAQYLELDGGVPVVGLAGAGPDGSVQFIDPGGSLGEAPAPPNASPKTVAVEVRGHSMRGVAEDGWFVYYDDRRDPPTDDLLGRLCVVGLADGRVLVKTLIRGRKRNHFDLESMAAPTIQDARINWAARVTAIVPR